MNELIDKELLRLFEGLNDKVGILFGTFISDAQAIAACFMLIYFGMESFKMMSGDKKLEIMPLLRPFILGLILIFWCNPDKADGGNYGFLGVISYPSKVLTSKAKGMYEAQLDEVEMMSRYRYALIDSVAIELMKTSLEVERAESEVKEKTWHGFGIDFSAIGDKIAGLWLYVIGKVKMMFFQIIEFAVVTVWQVCTYIIFFLQIIFTGILSILGPLAIAFSILPAFRDAWIQWISRYISVSLYTCIAYIVLSLSLVVMQFSLDKEIRILEYALKDEATFIMYTSMTSGGVNTFITTCLLGAISMLTIPFVSTWIISTTGVGNAIGGMVAGTMAVAKAGTGAVTSGV
jgi:hypothetical protein